MPGLNGTGPIGQGSQTGRGLGKCSAGKNNRTDKAATESITSAFSRGVRRCGQFFQRQGQFAQNENRGIGRQGRGFRRGK